jgi:opacity protein-like surface antigen
VRSGSRGTDIIGRSAPARALATCLSWMACRRTALGSAGPGLPLLALLLTLWSAPASAYEQRPGTLSLGLQGGGGVWSGEGAYVVTTDRGEQTSYDYANFGWGGGLGIHLRYCLDPGHALGISLEDQRFGRKSGVDPNAPTSARQYQLNNYLVDYYAYVNRRAKTTPYVVLGVGYRRATFRFGNSETVIPPGGLVANLGLGLEYFVCRPFSIDGTIRGYYHRGGGGSGVATEAQIGFQYYLLH